MCWTPLYVNKNKSHGTQNVKTLNRTTQKVSIAVCPCLTKYFKTGNIMQDLY